MAEIIQTRWDAWKNIQKNAVDWDGPTPLAKAFEKYLGCPTEYFPPMPDDDPLRAALAYATRYGQRDGFVPVLIVEDETLWDTLIFNSDHANDGAEDYKFDPDKVAEYRKQLLEKPTKNASEVQDRLIGDRRCEAEDDEMDWDEEILGEVAGGETIDHCAWWNSETNLTHPIILAKIPVKNPWEIFAWLPFGGWNECPDTEDMMAIRLRGIVRQLIPVLPQQPQRGLAIHAVLITSQRNHSNLEFRHCFLLQFMGETQGALPLDPSRALPCTREGSSTLSTPISRLSWSLFHAMPACLSTVHPHCPPYPQVTAKTSNRNVHCEGFQRAIAKPFGRSRRSEIPCNMKNQVA